MVDITLSSDRIRTAPIEVRRWIENELADSLGMRSAASIPVHHPQLVGCTREEVAQIFEFVRGMPPVVSVLFELGRSSTHRLPSDVVMASLADIAEHAHLQRVSQVVACLKIINDALQELRSDNDALLCAADEEERCYVSSTTQEAIHDVWREMVAAQAREAPKAVAQVRAVAPSCAPPYSIATPSSAAESRSPSIV